MAYTSRVERGLAKEGGEASVEREVREEEDGVHGDGDEVEEDEPGWVGEYGEVFGLSMGSSCMGTEIFGSLKEYGASSTEGER